MSRPTTHDSCSDCIFFRNAYKDVKVEQTKTQIPIAVLNGLPRNGDGSINYEDLLFAINARKALEERE